MKKISVIMASYLGDYDNAATNRVEKFERAVQSFLAQDYENRELIIVADGCMKTVETLHDNFPAIQSDSKNKVKLIVTSREGHFAGNARNKGLQRATGDIICYLDTDDMLRPDHLSTIAQEFPDWCDWVYYNDFRATVIDGEMVHVQERENIVAHGRIGTSSIAHRKSLEIVWPDGYGHDWILVEQMLVLSTNNAKIKTPGYVVCHIPGIIDL